MKKFLFATVMSLTILLSNFTSYADESIKVYVDGNEVVYDSQPIIKNGNTLVPLRKTFEALGADVNWDPNSKTITSVKDNNVIALVVGYNKAYKNGNTVDISIAPSIINGRTYVPLRFVAESFGANVNWDGNTNSVIIKIPSSAAEIEMKEDEYIRSLTSQPLTFKRVYDEYVDITYDIGFGKDAYDGTYEFYTYDIVQSIYSVPDMTDSFMMAFNAQETFSGIRMKKVNGKLYFNSDDLIAKGILKELD